MRSLACPTILALALNAPLGAQSQLASYEGSQPDEHLNHVAGGHDLNGDGVDDLVLGGREPSLGVTARKVQAISGATGKVLWSVQKTTSLAFGEALCLIPDLSGDGVRDLMVGAFGGSGGTSPGEFYVFSGATGALILTRSGFQADCLLGFAVAGDFDWDRDGVSDIAAGGPTYDGGATDTGYVVIYSGQTGVLLDVVYGSTPNGQFGYALAGGGDFDGDGFNDLAVGEPYFGLGGKVSFLPGTATIKPIYSGARYGAALACLGDLGGDGRADWLIGAPARDNHAGTALIHGQDISAHLPVGGPLDQFGIAVAGLGDVDGDGVGDLAVTAVQGQLGGPGYLRVYSGRFQTLLFERQGTAGDYFGIEIAGVGDPNGDGVPDVAVGSSLYPGGVQPTGRVQVFSGGGPGFVNYCSAGTSTSGCTAAISGSGTPSAVLALPFTLSASGFEGDKRGLFFYGWNGRQANPWGAGSGFHCVVPPVKRTPVQDKTGTPGACNGQVAFDLNAYWQAKPGKNPGAGAVVQAQFWHRDPAHPSGQPTGLSGALEFVVAP